MMRASPLILLMMLWASAAAGQEKMPIFDAHMHYSQPAWEAHDAAAVSQKLDAANVIGALVSSSPDDGTLKLFGAEPARFNPVLRPYREGVGPGTWISDADTPAYLAERLKRGVYLGIGEFHVADAAQVDTPVMRAVIRLAVERGIMLHVHAGAAPIRALFEAEPSLRILWAHAGLSTPPETVGAVMDEQPRLLADLSFRAAQIARGDALDPVWRDLLTRHKDRFMIGTDTYVTPRWDAYEAIVEAHRRWLALMPRDVAVAIAYGNALREFGK